MAPTSLNYFGCVFAAACGTLLFGYHMAELNAPQSVIRCQETNSQDFDVPECIPMSVSEFGFVNSIFAVGGLLGAMSAGGISDKYGRMGAQLFNTVPFILGGLILTFSIDVWSMAFGRFLSGIGSGIAAVFVPLYIQEVTSPSLQGIMAATTQVSVNFGILLTQTLGLFLSDSTHWRYILAVGAIVPGFQLLLAKHVVESPKWLVNNNREEDAKEALVSLRGGSKSEAEEEYHYLISQREGHASVETETLLHDDVERQPPREDQSPPKSDKVGFREFLTAPKYRRQLVVVLGIMCIQQLSGINGIVMYGVAVLRDLFPSSSGLINVFISFINLAITATAASFFGRVGRKTFIMLSIAGMAFFAFLLGIGIIWSIPILSALATILFVSSFSIGLGPLPWIVASEVVPFRALGAAQSLALAANWIGTFAISFGFPIVADLIGVGQTFWMFAVINTVSLWLVWTHLPESKGASSPDDVWDRFDQKNGAARLRSD